MPLIPNNAIVTYVGQFSPGIGYNSSSVQAAIVSGLASAGFSVLTYTSTGEGFFSVGTEQLTVTLQAKIQTGFSYSNESDVASIINHVIFEKFGVLPAGSIPRFILPQSAGGGTTDTGQPGGTGRGASGCIAGTSNNLAGSFSLSCWFSNLTTKGLSTVGLLAIAVAVAVGIFIFAPRPRVTVG